MEDDETEHDNTTDSVAEQSPRFASPFSGPEGLRNQMRHILNANRKRRLRRTPTPK